MKRAAALLLLVMSLPTLANAQADPAATQEEERREQIRSCRTIAKQIAHFEVVRDEARERDNELWQRSTEQHLGRLRARQLRDCPEDVPPSFSEKLAAFLAAAGNIALTALTLGAL